jgi:hypothetical protein
MTNDQTVESPVAVGRIIKSQGPTGARREEMVHRVNIAQVAARLTEPFKHLVFKAREMFAN